MSYERSVSAITASIASLLARMPAVEAELRRLDEQGATARTKLKKLQAERARLMALDPLDATLEALEAADARRPVLAVEVKAASDEVERLELARAGAARNKKILNEQVITEQRRLRETKVRIVGLRKRVAQIERELAAPEMRVDPNESAEMIAAKRHAAIVDRVGREGGLGDLRALLAQLEG